MFGFLELIFISLTIFSIWVLATVALHSLLSLSSQGFGFWFITSSCASEHPFSFTSAPIAVSGCCLPYRIRRLHRYHLDIHLLNQWLHTEGICPHCFLMGYLKSHLYQCRSTDSGRRRNLNPEHLAQTHIDWTIRHHLCQYNPYGLVITGILDNIYNSIASVGGIETISVHVIGMNSSKFSIEKGVPLTTLFVFICSSSKPFWSTMS